MEEPQGGPQADPWHEGMDPLAHMATSPDAPGPGASSSAAQEVAPTYTMATPTVEPPAQRIIHDVPPVWDGADPDGQAEPYLKLLAGWLATTRTLKTQRGMTILHYSHGDLKLLINELSVDQLTAEDGGMTVRKHVHNNYVEYLEKKLPKAMDTTPIYMCPDIAM